MYIPALESALVNMVRYLFDPAKDEITKKEYRVGFRGSFGDNHVDFRSLCARHAGTLISIAGVVAQCGFIFFSTI
jgi:DNA replication licensing factor MCM3